MNKNLVLILGLAGLESCQPTVNNELGGPVEIAQASAANYVPAKTEAAALAAVTRTLAAAHKLRFYKLDSARVSDRGSHWEVLLPRVDSVSRMLIRLDADKTTGYVHSTRLSYRVLNQ